jgi:hypothetical protein
VQQQTKTEVRSCQKKKTSCWQWKKRMAVQGGRMAGWKVLHWKVLHWKCVLLCL